MPEYLTPGVYIEEIERGPRPIEGVPTSTAAFLGETERGPVWPRLVTSYSEYTRLFGGVFAEGKYMPQAASGFFDNGGRRLYVCRIVKDVGVTAFASRDFGDFFVQAVGPGAWGKQVWAKIEPGTTRVPDPDNKGSTKPLGFRLKLAYWSKIPDGFTPFDPFDLANRLKLPRPTAAEDYDDLVTDPASPSFYGKRIGRAAAPSSQNTSLATLERKDSAAPDAVPAPGEGLLDQGGDQDDTALGVADYKGEDADVAKRRGLAALLLDEFREVALVYAPAASTDIVNAIIDHCELHKFSFAVVDSDSGVGNAASLDPRTSLQDSQYAAFYYPWLEIADPDTGARRKVPPGGHVIGVYARTDVNRGVFKAPANEGVNGALNLEYNIDDKTQGVLNPRSVNVIRKFPGYGIKIWGARTLSANTLWKYVPVRRLFIFLEHSIYDGTQWVVFEPNDERLWARVKDTIRLFLRGQWRAGALMGEREEQAFFVTCDRTTMTQDDILNGRLICEIGISPVRPAEFVIFRIFQNTAEAQR
jgi:phage tail sheath protein FI